MNSLLLFFFPSNIPALPIYLGEKERKKVFLFQIPNKDVSVFQLCVIAQMRKNNIIYMANVVKWITQIIFVIVQKVQPLSTLLFLAVTNKNNR